MGGWSSLEMVLRYAYPGGHHLKWAASRIDGTNLAQRAEFGKLSLVGMGRHAIETLEWKNSLTPDGSSIRNRALK